MGRTIRPMSRYSLLSPEALLGVRLSGIASRNRYTRDPAPVVAEMIDAAGDRTDILAWEAGTWAGFHEHDPDAQPMVRALAQIEGALEWIAVGRERYEESHQVVESDAPTFSGDGYCRPRVVDEEPGGPYDHGMCGRFALDDTVNASITEFVERTGRRPDEWAPDWEARWNIKPTQDIAVLVDSPKDRRLRFERAHWSLIPPWSDSLKTKFPTFNARTEGITEKRTWAKPVKSTRAIVLASGYYEWTGEKGSKQPWWIHPDDGLIGFAGLYSWWRDRSRPDDDPDRWVLTATILTAPAVPSLEHIHDRTPVILPEGMWEQWIDPTIVGDQALVDEAVAAGRTTADQLDAHRVAPFKTTDDGPELTAPID